jgi:hypothetical protein
VLEDKNEEEKSPATKVSLSARALLLALRDLPRDRVSSCPHRHNNTNQDELAVCTRSSASIDISCLKVQHLQPLAEVHHQDSHSALNG